MNHAAHRFCAWSGVIMIMSFVLAFILVADFIPPVPPSLVSQEVHQIYQENSLSIRMGMAIAQLGVALGFVFSGAVATWTSKMEGSFPVLSFAQIACAFWSFGGAYLGIVNFSAAAFRADRGADIVYALNDVGWYWIVYPGSCAVLQFILCGIAILSDKRERPIFPRWLGYFNVWMGVIQIPGVMMTFFHTGPFAWDGLFTFWMPLTTFSFWIFGNCWGILQAVKRDAGGESFALNKALPA